MRVNFDLFTAFKRASAVMLLMVSSLWLQGEKLSSVNLVTLIDQDSVFQNIDLRSFEDTAFNKYYDQESFNYKHSSSDIASNFWEALFRWIASLLPEKTANDISDLPWWVYIRVILWSLGIFAVAMIVNSLVKYGAFSVMTSDSKEQTERVNFKQIEKGVLVNDWLELISSALEKNQFNIAVRMLFLHTLQQLHQHQFIRWEEGKTSTQYRDELTNQDIDIADFQQLSRYYDYTWFGDVSIDQKNYALIENKFRTFLSMISKR